jgi:beta-mannanase
VVVLAAGIVAAVLGSHRGAATTSTVGCAAAPEVADVTAMDTVPAPSTARPRFGVATSADTAALDSLARRLGESPSIVMWYDDFEQPPPLDRLRAASGRGALPLITWEPWTWGHGVDQPEYRTARIAAGDEDIRITQWAEAIAAWGGPVMLRFGHEMNTTTYPWSDLVNGNVEGDFVRAWRHVHDVFVQHGATNVRWVWSPNAPYAGTEALYKVFPGSYYVDDVALDGYNWGTTQSWSRWMTPCEIFSTGLSELHLLAPHLPVIIAETGCTEEGGDKALWVRQLWELAHSDDSIAAVVIFDQDKETDWRISSSDSALEAFAGALRWRRDSS